MLFRVENTNPGTTSSLVSRETPAAQRYQRDTACLHLVSNKNKRIDITSRANPRSLADQVANENCTNVAHSAFNQFKHSHGQSQWC